jgi:hypothetical protein
MGNLAVLQTTKLKNGSDVNLAFSWVKTWKIGKLQR